MEQDREVTGASLRETGSHASHEAPEGLRPTGFDPARIDALACECERQVAAHLATAYDGMTPHSVSFDEIDLAVAAMNRAMRLREILAIVITSSARNA